MTYVKYCFTEVDVRSLFVGELRGPDLVLPIFKRRWPPLDKSDLFKMDALSDSAYNVSVSSR